MDTQAFFSGASDTSEATCDRDGEQRKEGDPGRKDIETETDTEDNDECGMTELRLVLIGKTGAGKSASGNTILGQRHFLSKLSASSVTQTCEQGILEYVEGEETESGGVRRRRRRVVVVDMPGFGDTRFDPEHIRTEIARCVAQMAPGPHAFLLVIQLGRYTEDEARAVKEVEQIFGEQAILRHSVIVFTRGDDLEETDIEEYLRYTAPEDLKSLLERCGRRYHVLNNRKPEARGQVWGLLEKVKRMVEINAGGCYTNSMFQEAEAAIREEQTRLMKEREAAEAVAGPSMDGAKRRKTDLKAVTPDSEEERLCGRRTGWRRGRGGKSLAASLESALRSFRKEAIHSDNVLDKIKILVAAAVTGVVVGAACGAAVPLAVAAGATLVGQAVGMGGAVGTVVAATTGSAVVAVGSAMGVVLGGSVGALAGADAPTPLDASVEALRQVGVMGATAVGVAAGVGVVLGTGAALGACGAATSPAAAVAGEGVSAAGVANSAVAQAVGSVEMTGPVMVAEGAPAVGALVGPVGADMAAAGGRAATGFDRMISAATEMGRVAAGIAMAGGLVVKVVKEKVRQRAGPSESSTVEKTSWEFSWNKR